ncbi:site-specific recombinase [Azohydromonas sediminis]|uniref:site-specific recombinase n=1 Tax=Azohydromonas sediminis TaxID=2259674 RepID=UPI000E65A3AC|nr:recombinase [Azohydromonas sediminis]
MAVATPPSSVPAAARQRGWDLPSLLTAADPRAPLAERHRWLIGLTQWLRAAARGPTAAADADRTPLPVLRLRHLVDVLERHGEPRARVAALLAQFWRDVDVASLFADLGYGTRMSLWSELRHRLALRLLPATPETRDLAELFVLLFPSRADADRLRAIDDETLQRLVALVAPPPGHGDAHGWRRPLLDAATFLATHIAAAGVSAPLRRRMDPALVADAPFPQLVPATTEVVAALRAGDDALALRKLPYLRALVDACARAADSVHAHLEEFGVSVDIVFEVEQLKSRARRLDEVLGCLVSPAPAHDVARLLADLVDVAHRRLSVRSLFERHYALLARKLTERNAEVGSHYITRNAAEYRAMLRAAAGGGAVIALTTFVKFAIGALALGAFWTGFWAGVNYAASFVVVMLLGWTVATKQPAMTAPAMAAKLRAQLPDDEVAAFVDEVTHLIRSQAAGIFGNLALVFPLVLAVQLGWAAAFGAPPVGPETAEYVLHSLTLLGPTALFAAFTGVLLFASSIVAGWVENAFVFHRLDSAIAHHPALVARLGAARARRWAAWWRANVSGVAANVSLGMMLGLVPAVLGFFALPVEVRHVTLSTGQLAAAIGALGPDVLQRADFWWCVAGIAATGVLNVGVSFYLAFKLALRATGVQVRDRARVARAIRRRLLRRPLSFLWPPREAPGGP